MARKLVVYNKTTRAIVQVADYDSKAVSNQAWLDSLTANDLSFVDVDGVTTNADFQDRTVDATVPEKSVKASISDVDFPLRGRIALTVPKNAKQGSSLSINVAAQTHAGGGEMVTGNVDYQVCFPDKDDIVASGTIALLGGLGSTSETLPSIIPFGDGSKTRVLVRVQMSGRIPDSDFVEMTV